MASTYTPIATYTTSGTTASYTFTSIPTTYTDIVCVISGTATGTANLMFQVGNGSVDTGSNYSTTLLYGDGSSAGSARLTSQTQALNEVMSTTQGTSIINFQNYSNTTTYKTMICRGGTAANASSAYVDLWRSTAAINTIKIYPGIYSFSAGTTLTLYGIKAA